MSRERILIRYALPALIIVSLVLYLGLRNRDRLLYDLPQLPEMAVAEVDRVEIVKGDRLVAVRKQGDGWLLEPDEFPAATAQVDTMVRALASLEITDLVSEHSAYSRFELDPESALRITAFRGGTVLRTVELGKEARTYQHTYVKVEGDPRVYQAAGDLGNYFPVVGDVLRDKLVLKVDIDTVGEIVARSPGEELVLRKRPALEEGAAPDWVTADGGEWNSAKVAESLQRLANLSTFRFAEGPPAPGNEVLELTLKTEVGATHTVTVYARSGNSYPAISSGSDYPFLLYSCGWSTASWKRSPLPARRRNSRAAIPAAQSGSLFVVPAGGSAVFLFCIVFKPDSPGHRRRNSSSARRLTSSQGVPADRSARTRRARRSISAAQGCLDSLHGAFGLVHAGEQFGSHIGASFGRQRQRCGT